MAFGKRPEFPNSRQIGPNLLVLGAGTASDGNGPAARILSFICSAYEAPYGTSPETALSAIGALAGFAAQQAIWEGFVKPGHMAPEQAFIVCQSQDGEIFFYGDMLNTILVSTKRGELSIWRFVAGGAADAGIDQDRLPDLKPIFKHCAATAGTTEFGIPTWTGNRALKEAPRDALRHWSKVKNIFETARTNPLHWPLEIAVAANKLIGISKKTVSPDKAAFIVMEAAISMSKVNPKLVPGGVGIIPLTFTALASRSLH